VPPARRCSVERRTTSCSQSREASPAWRSCQNASDGQPECSGAPNTALPHGEDRFAQSERQFAPEQFAQLYETVPVELSVFDFTRA